MVQDAVIARLSEMGSIAQADAVIALKHLSFEVLLGHFTNMVFCNTSVVNIILKSMKISEI